MTITVAMLREAKACEDQVALFQRTFPRGAKVTPKNCLKALRVYLDLDWAARYLLPKSAWEAYEKATAPAWEAYEKATAPAFCKAAKEAGL